MKIFINRNEEEFDGDKLALYELLEKKELTFKRLLIRVNGEVINEENKSSVILNEGDQLDIVRIISGG
ncbi:MAG: thiamine biosynthesis protein ThiS [Salinivirgaceae bacterium]|nr:MAG: thiamine biosynthesis protein ThiS [Salinivirgaceae bacterium]